MAKMDGRNTPVRALTQMTNVQKATESGTPVNPLWDSGTEAVAGTASENSGRKNRARKSSSRSFGAFSFRSTDAGAMGTGAGVCSLLLAHGQAVFPSQQEWKCAVTVGQGCLKSAPEHGWTWESWITSPKNKPTMDFNTVTGVRVTLWMIIPIFFSRQAEIG